ncbi:uncharacterized protein LODBEIA_P23120 [Lodderomyces beijingensis]|uniref:candidapepsin n=1 Tax=Lodderomyces beijingensis TaxID=1775926 RepID=A0ABP0ZKC6_9ASCO
MVSVFTLTKQALTSLAFALLAQGFVIPGGPENEKRNGAGFVSLDFNVVRDAPHLNTTHVNTSDHNLASHAAKFVPLTLDNLGPTYVANITIGSNKQPQTVQIDTGSSDLWVFDIDLECENGLSCFGDGSRFNPKTSTTFESLGTKFSIEYADHSTSEGTWAKDTVGFGGISITKQQFADVNLTSSTNAIMGISVVGSESHQLGYDNVPITLKKQGIIKTNAYSLFLNEPEAATGQIIFGGVDHAKYSGSLIEEEIQTTVPQRLAINLNELNFNGTKYNISTPALLDSGTTLTYLEKNVADSLAAKVGAVWFPLPTGGAYVLGCGAGASGDALFTFEKGAAIRVPMSEFYYGQGLCTFGVQPIPEELGISALLGDNFLRHAYVLYNLDANTISLAPVNFTDKSDIEAI